MNDVLLAVRNLDKDGQSEKYLREAVCMRRATFSACPKREYESLTFQLYCFIQR